MSPTTPEPPETDLSSDSGDDGEIGFVGAMAELRSIVIELEADMLDVDVLAERVERAAYLVELCRGRLDSAKLRVDEIVVRLRPDDSQSVAPDGEESGSERPV